MLRERLKVAVRSSLVAVGLAVFMAGPLYGQARGKIQGRVVDAATGAPIAGAQVTVEGTTFGNLTNDQGFYFINEVGAGEQSIRAQFIGYRAMVVENERILAGQTTTMNFELEQTAVELEAITVEGERNPLVPRDQTVSKSIVKGELVDQAPFDNSSEIILLQPGVVQTNRGVTIRGGRANEEAVFIDGVLVRSFGTGRADNVQVPTNSLQQVDVTVGAFAAEFGEAQSGIISFVTRSGGPRFTGSLELQTDQISPDSWRTNFNRLEATLGGPIVGPLTFFLAGTFQSNFFSRNDGMPDLLLNNGAATCPDKEQYAAIGCAAGQTATFATPATSNVGGATDFIDLTAPSFVDWDNGRTQPYNFRGTNVFTGNLNWQLPRGSRINFAYTRNDIQNYGRGGAFNGRGGTTPGASLYRTDNVDGTVNTRNVFTLGWFQTITQSATQQLALDFRASYQTDKQKNGAVDYDWWQDNRDPFLGYTLGSPEFVVPEDTTLIGFKVFEPTDEFVQVVRSGAVPADSLQIYPARRDLIAIQSLPGLSADFPLRSNPYGWKTGHPTAGVGNTGLSVRNEERLQLRGALDWQLGRFNRLKFGGEYIAVDVSFSNVNLYQVSLPPETSNPKRWGAFLQDRLDIGDLVLEGGIRIDGLTPNVEYPTVPGFVFNVPDSLKAGFVSAVPTAPGDPVSFAPLDPACNGASSCASNYHPGQNKTEVSPRLGASFPVTPTSTFRLSYGKFVQTPAFFTGAAVGTIGLMRNINNDLRAGTSNTNTTFARDVDLPSTRTFEFGYRQLFGTNLVIDVAAYNKKQRAGLTFRKLPYEDPTNPGQIFFLNALTNNDFTETNGLDAKVDWAVGNLFQTSVAYSFLTAAGTGSDPFTYTGLILRGVSNIATITGLPEQPPEVLLPLEQSRTHNISMTGSLLLPSDMFEKGTAASILFNQFGAFFVLSVRSGLPFTKLINQGLGQVGPPSFAGLNGIPQTQLSALQTPWQTTFDIRFTKGFDTGAMNWQLFLDWRNPFGLKNTQQVFIETADPVNELFRTTYMAGALRDANLDGDTDVDDFDIAAESPDYDFNKFMLMQAEERFGNGDGIFTVAEQELAFGTAYEQVNAVNNFVVSNQQLRLGVRLAF